MRITGLRRGAALASFLIATLAGCAGNDLPVDATPDQVLGRAEQKLADEDYYDAAEFLEYFLRTYPGTGQTPYAKLLLGDARFGMEEYILASGDYEDVVRDYPASPYVEEARYKIARCAHAAILPYYLDQTETERAVRLFEDFKRDHPQSRFTPEVTEAIAVGRATIARGEFENGKFYQRQKRLRSAAVEYKFVVENYPETEFAAEAAVRLGEIYTSRERFEDARYWYRRVMTDWPETDAAELAQEALTRIPHMTVSDSLPTDSSSTRGRP